MPQRCHCRLIANRLSTYVMYDCHLFRELKGASVDALIEDWRRECETPDRRYGRPYLCPIIVLNADEELRRVGAMVFPAAADTEKRLSEWRRAVEADADIVRLLAERVGG